MSEVMPCGKRETILIRIPFIWAAAVDQSAADLVERLQFQAFLAACAYKLILLMVVYMYGYIHGTGLSLIWWFGSHL